MGDSVSLNVANDLSAIRPLNEWYDAEVVCRDLQRELSSSLRLCLNEAITNVISYGFPEGQAYPSGDPSIKLSLSFSNASVVAVLEDNGQPFDPLQYENKQPYTDLESAEIGGFGIKLMREMATNIEYTYRSGQNILTIYCNEKEKV